jgi:hypothetical protein
VFKLVANYEHIVGGLIGSGHISGRGTRGRRSTTLIDVRLAPASGAKADILQVSFLPGANSEEVDSDISTRSA